MCCLRRFPASPIIYHVADAYAGVRRGLRYTEEARSKAELSFSLSLDIRYRWITRRVSLLHCRIEYRRQENLIHSRSPHVSTAFFLTQRSSSRGRQPLSITMEHRYAVRRLRYSPHPTGILATASYDMTAVLFESKPLLEGATIGGARGRLKSLVKCAGHTEFVSGLAFSLFEPRLVATCAWDRRLCIWS